MTPLILDSAETTAAQTPLTQKGKRTRQTLIDAAREVFIRTGYFDSKLTDITDQAGCSVGTLYTYFANREEIMAAVIEDTFSDQPTNPPAKPANSHNPIARIRLANRRYIDHYRTNAGLMKLMNQVAAVDESVNRFRLNRAEAFVERNALAIAELQAAGIAQTTLDPHLCSRALSGMVSRMCYATFVDGIGHSDVATEAGLETFAETLTTLWVNALQISSFNEERHTDDRTQPSESNI